MYLFIRLIVIVLFGFAVASGASEQRPTDIPATLSKLIENKSIDLKIDKGRCNVQFSDTYGLNSDKEFKYLLRLIQYGAWIKVDISCNTAVYLDALNHLMKLAIEQKSSKAAKIMLLDYQNLGLDGEIGEFYVESHMAKVLSTSSDIKNILDTPQKTKKVASDLCIAWKNPNGELELAPLVEQLEKRKSSEELVNTIRNVCAEAFQ